MNKLYKVEISAKTIVFAVLFILFLYFLWLIKDLLFSLFIAFILMCALRPPVLWLEHHKVPRTAAALIVYILFILFFIFLISLIIPPIVTEISALVANIPALARRIDPTIYNRFNISSLTQYVPSVTGNVFNILGGFASNTFFVISTMFFGFYLLLQENILKTVLSQFFDEDRTLSLRATVERAEKRMSAWFWGEFTLMTVVGVLTFIGLNIIGMKYALALAVLAGLLEVVPTIGPIISAVPAVLIALAYSPFLAGACIALYIIVQQLENNLIVPIIMKNAVGLNPLVTLIALVIGGRIGGTLGVLLAIPLYLFLEVLFLEFVLKRIPTSAEKVR
jgi:predicted PurR-regulated permease PerM